MRLRNVPLRFGGFRSGALFLRSGDFLVAFLRDLDFLLMSCGEYPALLGIVKGPVVVPGLCFG